MYIFYLIISNIIHVFISLVSASTFLQPDPPSRTDLILVAKTYIYYIYGPRWVSGHVTILVYYHVTRLCLRNRDIIELDDDTKLVMFSYSVSWTIEWICWKGFWENLLSCMMKQATKQAVPVITIFPAQGKNFYISKMSEIVLR